MNEQKLLQIISTEYQSILKENLVGIYLHGSLALGCFNWTKSDIDFIVVVRNTPAPKQKRELIAALLRLCSMAPPKGFEMSVVLASVCKPFVYPTPFVLHFSNTYRARFEENLDTCLLMQGEDPDLAAHFTVIRHGGLVLTGAPIAEVFGPVPPAAYWDSLRLDILDSQQDVMANPIYVILNLCRVLAFLREDLVLSKQQGGEWALQTLPEANWPVIREALAAYGSDAAFGLERAAVEDFCTQLFEWIDEAQKTANWI